MFSVDPNTGRLSLVLNQQIKDPSDRAAVDLLPCRHDAEDDGTSGSSCVFTLNSDANQTVFPYIAGRNGQLTLTTNSTINSGATRATSIIAGGTSVYITDAGPANSNTPGTDPAVHGGGDCVLAEYGYGRTYRESVACGEPGVHAGGQQRTNICMWRTSRRRTRPHRIVRSRRSRFRSNGTLQVIPDAPNNPYPIGARAGVHGGGSLEPVSVHVEWRWDGDGQGSGSATPGKLSNLTRGSTFTAVGQATCLAVSGNVD